MGLGKYMWQHRVFATGRLPFADFMFFPRK